MIFIIYLYFWTVVVVVRMFCRRSYFNFYSHLGFFASIFQECLWNNLFINFISLVIPRYEIENMKIKLPIKDNKFESVRSPAWGWVLWCEFLCLGVCVFMCVCVCMCDCFINRGQYLLLFLFFLVIWELGFLYNRSVFPGLVSLISKISFQTI